MKVLSIVGPTASGKSSIAIEIAKLFNGEIISCDSMQVYKGFDIGTAKIKKEEMQGIVHHLIDILEPNQSYSVMIFQKLARDLIEDITKRNKLPILVGGTGLYSKACIYDYNFNKEESLDDQFLELSNEELYHKVLTLDPKCTIHKNNRRRLVRALNVILKHNKTLTDIKNQQLHKPIYNCLYIARNIDRQTLYKISDLRVDKMIEDGLLDEISNLIKNNVDIHLQPFSAIGYKEFIDYFFNNKDLNLCIEEVKRNTRRFIKRQYTWFNNQVDVKWFDDNKQAIKLVKEFYEAS